MTVEIYRPIIGFEGYYEVSNLGNVRRVFASKNHVPLRKILKPCKCKNGYYKISLKKNGKLFTPSVHRLVCATFLEKSNKCVNHKDFNKANNQLSNLEYVTSKENTQHALAGKGNWAACGEKNGLAILTNNIVSRIRNLYKLGLYSQKKLAIIFGTDQSNISYIVNYKTWRQA